MAWKLRAGAAVDLERGGRLGGRYTGRWRRAGYLAACLGSRRVFPVDAGILNVASASGFLPGPFMSVYFATKHYVVAFSESLADELRHTGVRVTALCPPPVGTAFVQSAGIAATNFMATTRVGPAAVARFGYRMMNRHRLLAVYSWQYRLLTTLVVRITPRWGLRRLMHRLNATGRT